MQNFGHSGIIHLRHTNLEGGIQSRGGLTVVYDIHNYGLDSFLTLAMARCSLVDNFNKSIGRAIATGRLKNLNKLVVGYNMPLTVEDAQDAINNSTFGGIIQLSRLIPQEELEDIIANGFMRPLEEGSDVSYIQENEYAFNSLLIEGFMSWYVNQAYSIDGQELVIDRVGRLLVITPAFASNQFGWE